jgi:5-methyltetrahydropteroyltriglutamate--homocysteine methyltransferase
VQRSTDRIITTHAGSLPRPADLSQAMFEVADSPHVDHDELTQRVRNAVADVVARQRAVGIDVVSDGEMGKIGFSTYVLQRFSGFGDSTTYTEFRALDLAEVPQLAGELFGDEGSRHIHLPVVERPLELRDPDAIRQEIDDLLAALDGAPADTAFISAVSPGHLAWQFPNKYYGSGEDYLRAAAEVLGHEYRAIVEAGLNLQIDSPNVAMAQHFTIGNGENGSDVRHYLDATTEALNDALSDLPAERIRLHICWGNYGGPHHKDVELDKIIEPLLRTHAGFISFEAANPRHQHEWRVWEKVELPEEMAMIPGVIDTNTNRVEHPELVAERLERFATIVGRERVIAGTDCGFATFNGMHSCHPEVAWLKLRALVDGAQIASERLWS